MRSRVVDFVVIVAVFAAGALLQRCVDKGSVEVADCRVAQSDTVVVRDTVMIDRPVMTASRDIGYIDVSVAACDVTDALQVADTVYVERGQPTDSLTVRLPIEQSVYEDTDYKAWVSGYRATLDSIMVFPKHETVTIRPAAKRWHIGATVGYGYTPQGFKPYVGVGLTYSVFGF